MKIKAKNKLKNKKILALFTFATIIIVIIGLRFDTKTIDKNEGESDEFQNKIYGDEEFVAEYKKIGDLYVFENPLDLDPNHWYDTHQYYPVDYGYTADYAGEGSVTSLPVNIVEVNGSEFQFREVFSYPSNVYIVLTNYEKKMYMSVYENIPSTEDFEKMLEQISLISK